MKEWGRQDWAEKNVEYWRGQKPGAQIEVRPAEPVSPQVPIEVARRLPSPVQIPDDPASLNAIRNTPGVTITPDGIKVVLSRFQKPEQAGQPVNRGGVFYEAGPLGENTYGDDGDWDFGGSQGVEAPTLFRRPLVVSSWVSSAVDELWPPNRAEALDTELRNRVPDDAPPSEQAIAAILRDYGHADAEPLARYIVATSRSGLAARSAVLETIGADAARKAGYDSIISINPRIRMIGEVQDLREATYPTPEGGYSLRPEFAPASGDVAGIPDPGGIDEMLSPAAPAVPPPAPEPEVLGRHSFIQRLRYSSTLANVGNAVGDAITNLVRSAYDAPKMAVQAGIEAALGVPVEHRSATFRQNVGFQKGWAIGFANGLKDAGHTMLEGTDPVREEQARGLVPGKAGLALEFGPRIRVAADVLFDRVGEEAYTWALAYRQAEREDKKEGTKEWESRVQDIVTNVKARLLDVEQGGTATGKRALYSQLAGEVKTLQKAAIFQNELGETVKAVNNLRIKGAGIGAVVLFFKTSAAITAKGFDLTPGVGLTAGLKRLRDAKAGRGAYAGTEGSVLARTNDPAVQPLSAVLADQALGTLIAGLGALFVQFGWMTGGGPEDERERRAWRQDGNLPYALKIAGQQVPVTRILGPLAFPLMFGAIVSDHLSRGGKPANARTLYAFVDDLRDFAFDQSGLRAFGDLWEFLGGKGSTLDLRLRNDQRFAASLAGSFIPASGFLRQLRDATDATIRDPKDFLEQVRGGLPGLSHTVPPKRTETGEVIRRANTGAKAFVPTLPGYQPAPTQVRRYAGSKSAQQDAIIQRAKSKVTAYERGDAERPTAREYAIAERYDESDRYTERRAAENERKRK